MVGAAGFTLAPAGITAAGAATTEGTARADRLTGTAHDLVRGRAGGDLVRGRFGGGSRVRWPG